MCLRTRGALVESRVNVDMLSASLSSQILLLRALSERLHLHLKSVRVDGA